MTRRWPTYLLLVAGFALTAVLTSAQVRTKDERTKLFAQVAADEKAVAACVKSGREEQIQKFGKPLPPRSGHCWGGCPTRVVKPYYPDTARRLGVHGEVLVDTIVDEKGNVVFAKVRSGFGLLRKAALDAARASQYQPEITCGNRRVKFRWTIKYYFSRDM